MKSTKSRSKRQILIKAWICLLVLLSGTSANSQIAGGSALSLSGNDAYASVTLTSPLTEYTISAWVYLRSGGVFANPRVAVVSSLCGASAEFLITGNSSVNDPQYLELGRCFGFDGAMSTTPVPLNKWVQISVSVINNPGGHSVSFYINSTSAGTTVLPAANDTTLGPDLLLGFNNGAHRKFDGLLDEVQIWRGAAAAVTNHVLNGWEANLVAYYRFDEGSGTTSENIAYELGAGSATLQGSAMWTNLPGPPPPAGSPIPGSDWVAQGPAPIRDADHIGQVSGAYGIAPDYPVDGSVYTIAPHPTDRDIIYAAGPNGGIWKTANATSTNISWIPLTDQQPSLSMGCLEFDPTDGTHQTLVAGFGVYSSGSRGSPPLGLLRTIDGGTTWQLISPANLAGAHIHSVAARGSTLLAAAGRYDPTPQAGLYRSVNGGASFENLAGAPGSGLPAGEVDSLVDVPGNLNRFYAASRTNGIYRSDNTGANWVNVSSGIINAATGVGVNAHRVGLAVYNQNGVEVIYAAVIVNSPPGSTYAYFSTNAGVNWISIGNGIPNYAASYTHFSIGADPTNPNLAYVGGNGINVWRINRSNPSSPFSSLMGRVPGACCNWIVGGRSVHADSHAIKFDASGNLIQVDDGGIYLLPRLAATNGINGVTPDGLDGWRSLIGNLQLGEFYSVAYDPLARVVFGGTQDNGVVEQTSPDSQVWKMVYGGDAVKVAVDCRSITGKCIRYVSSGYVAPGNVHKRIYDSNGQFMPGSDVTLPLTVLRGGAFVPNSFAMELNAVDPRRLIVCGGDRDILESTDQGQTVRRLPNDFFVIPTSRMVYGGYQNGIPNPDVVWAVGYKIPNPSYWSIMLRTNATAPAQFQLQLTGLNQPQGIVANPRNWREAYFITSLGVGKTTDAGASWIDITANLEGGAQLKSLEFLPLPSGDALAVGTDDGVYITRLGVSPRWWTRLGSSLPRAIAFSLHYDPSDQILTVGTFGRGVWTYSLAGWPQTGGPGSAVDVSPVAGSYVRPQFTPFVTTNGIYSISAWINLRSGGQTYNPRVAIFSPTNCGDGVEFLVRSATPNAADPQYLELARCGSFDGVPSTKAVPLNQWVHVAVTVGGRIDFGGGSFSNLVSYYINGEPAGASYYLNQDLSIAPNVALAFNDGSTRKFDGLLDQVSVWNLVLTPADIRLIMGKQPTGTALDFFVKMSFNFNEGAGTTTLNTNGLSVGSLVGSVNWAPSGALLQTVSAVTTRAARNIADNNATLEASFVPQAQPASLTFEYGLTRNYGSVVQQQVAPRQTPTLDGLNDFIAPSRFVHDPQLFSLSLWFKTSSRQGGRLIGFGDSWTNASALRDRHLYLGTDGLVRFGVFSTTPHVITGGTACNDGRWHHVAGTFSQSNGMRLYLDGVPVANKPNVGAAIVNNGYWRIGWDTISDWPGGSPSGYFAGAIAEVQIWDTELPPEFIAGNYQCQLSGTETGLLMYYHLDEGGGGSALDSAPADGTYNALVFGQPTWTTTLDLPSCFSQNITNLQPGQTYHFRAVGVTPIGTNYSADGTFTTLLAPTAVTQPASGVTTNAATLNGTVNPGGAAAHYYFQYGGTTSYGSVTGVSNLVAGLTSVSVSNAIAGLSPGTLYHFRLIATNSVGTNAGADLTFTTLAVAPTAVTQSATAVTANAATLNGTVNPGGAAARYYFQHGPTTSYGSVTGVGNLVAGLTSVSVSNAIAGLSPGTLYHFRLIATNSVGTNTGADLTFTTLAVAPTAVTQSATSVTTNAATLNGAVNPGGAAARYYFQYGATTSYGSTTGIGNLVAGLTSVSVSNAISGLSPGTLYHFRLIATNNVGTNAGADLTFTTLVPPAISGVTLSGTNLIFSVTNGAPGGSWTLLTTTNLTVLANWSTNRSGTFDGLGKVTLTNGIITTEPLRFFRIRVP